MKRKVSFLTFCVFVLCFCLCAGCSDSGGDDGSDDGGETIDYSVWVHGGERIYSPGTVSCGGVSVGSYKDVTFDITNTCSANFTLLDVVTAGPGFVSNLLYTGTIMPGETKSFQVRFTPDSAGEHSAAVSVKIEGQDDFYFTLSGTGTEAYVLAPPSWIQGTWRIDAGGGVWLAWEFRTANAIHSSSSEESIDMAALNTEWASLGQDVGYTDTNPSGTQYNVMLKSAGVVQQTYQFTYKTPTTIDYTLLTMTFELTKQ